MNNNDFTVYRLKSGYSAKSIKVQNCHINRFKNWCINNNINLEEINYSQVLQYIDSERERGVLNQSIVEKSTLYVFTSTIL